MANHRHLSSLRGLRVIPRPQPGTADYTAVNYAYAGQTGSIHEVVTIGGRELAKVSFPNKKIVYYLLADLEQLPKEARRTYE